MLSLKEAEYRHDTEGKRVVNITVYTDNLSGMPTNPADIPGIENDDVIDNGSVALDVNTGDIAMYNGISWSQW